MNSTVCKNLRTKKMFIPGESDEVFAPAAEEPQSTSHCWCNCTLTETGPDDRPVGLRTCSDARSCFEE